MPERLHFPDHERRQPWLTRLLDIQHRTDIAVTAAIRRDGRALACARGCAACCSSHQDIPVYPLELMGIAWYLNEILEGALREQVRVQMAAHRSLGSCPFLVGGACALHPIRPMACRWFNVFNTVCASGEDAFHTRHGDVLSPDRQAQAETLRDMLRHHGIQDGKERRRLVESGEVHRLAQNLRDMRWETIAARMAASGNAG